MADRSPKKRNVHVLKRGQGKPALSQRLDEERAALIEQHGYNSVAVTEAQLRGWDEENIRKKEPLHRELFPGDPERARELGRIYEFFDMAIMANVLAVLNAEDQTDLLRVLQARIASYAKPWPLPSKAPKLWVDRDPDKPIDPAGFTRAVYARWFGKGFSRKDLRDLDPQLYHALSVWEHRHPEDRIQELPTLTEVIDRKIAALGSEFTEDELRKLGTTLQTRLRRTKK